MTAYRLDGRQLDGRRDTFRVDHADAEVGKWDVVDGVVAADRPATKTMPTWTRSLRHFRSEAIRCGKLGWGETKFQAAMMPSYWWVLAKESPRGLWLGIVAVARWTTAREEQATLEAGRAAGIGSLERLQRAKKSAVRQHVAADLAVLLVFLIAMLWLWAATGPVGHAALVAAVPGVLVPILGAVGRDPEAPPIVERWIGTGWRTPKLTIPLIRDAFEVVDLPGWSKSVSSGHPDRQLRPLAPVQVRARDDGWQVPLVLPAGFTIDDVRAKHKKLASGLSRIPQCVRIADSTYPGTAGLGRALDLIVLKQSMRDLPGVPWPWLDTPTAQDPWAPSPIGADESSDPVMMPSMVGEHGLIAGQTGSGKTGTAQTVLANRMFCPLMLIDIVDGKESGDWRPWKDLCEHYFPDASDPEVIARYLTSVAENVVERQALINKLRDDYETAYAAATAAGQVPPPDPFPHGAKVSPELAAKHPTLRPRVLLFEEIQTIFAEWPKSAKAEREACERALTIIAKKGRSAGVALILVSQQINADTLPTAISNNMGWRLTLSVSTHNEAIQASGLRAYQAGLDASQLSKEEDKGIAVLSGAAVAVPAMTKTHYLGDDLRAVVAAATRIRSEAGTLPDDAQDPEISWPERVAEIWPGNARRQAWSELAPLLVERWPVECSGWDVDQVSAAAAGAGLTTVQVSRKVDGRKTSLRGLARDEVMDAAAAAIAARADDNHNDD